MPRPLLHTALLAALLLASCSRSGGLEPIQAEEPLLELLAHPELREVVRERADFPMRQDLMKPRGSGTDDHGAYPALELRPPGEVLWRVPKTYPDAVLRFALGVKRGGYHGRGHVRFELTLDGEAVFAHELPCGEDLPREERRWSRFELPIGAGGELRLSATYQGDQPEPPVVGVGLLRVVVPFEVERQPARPDAPNVVLVVIDTLRADRLHVYGNAAEVSPAIDALAARGTVFEQAFSAAAWTLPSTASILTGASAPEHGLGFGDSYYLADSMVTLAEAFQRVGFTTAGFACNPLIARSRNFAQGFETFRDYSWPRGDDIQDEVTGWLSANADRRFFLYLHYVDPHYPYEPPAELRQGLVGPAPPGYLDREIDFYLPEFYATPEADLERLLATRDHQLALYDAEILGVDRAIARVMAKLRELGLEQNTVVAVTSDHGEEFLEHGWAGHHNQLHDETVRVPLILAGPGVQVGERASWPVENRFVATTLLALADVEAPGNLAGPLLLKPGAGEPTSIEDLVGLALGPVFFTNSKGRWPDLEARTVVEHGQVHGVIEGGWRLIWAPQGPTGGGEELVALYELASDPQCRRDVAAEHPERVARLKGLVQRWVEDSQRKSPRSLPADSSTLEMLIDIGYVSSDE